MRSLTSALALVMAAGFGLRAGAASPVNIWPRQFPLLDKTTLKAQADALDGAASTLPPSVVPALQFQKTFLRMISGEPPSAWREEIEKLAASKEQDPVQAGIAEIARAWLARLEMADINTTLHNYYRHNVRFPAALAEVETDIPEKIRNDPWGDPWIYKPTAPQGFEKLESQRYQLGPTRFPQLGNLADAVRRLTAQMPSWTIVLHDIGGSKALEFRSERAGTPVITTIQAGGRVDDCILLYIGDGWALMAGPDQLFAVPF